MRVQTVKVDADVRDVIAGALEEHAGGSLLKLPGELERKLYQRVDLVLNAAGGRWNRKQGGHVFEGDPRAKLEEALGGELVDDKKTRQAFYTPEVLAIRMVALAVGSKATPKPFRVLEPSAGEGAIVKAVLKAYPRALVTAIEIDGAALQKTVSAMQSLAVKPDMQCAVFAGDFLAQQPSMLGPYDAAVMNPPWTRGQDVEHVMFAWQLVAPGGRLVALVSPSALTSQGKKQKPFQELCSRHMVHKDVLPPGTFKESGTMVGAHLIVLEK